MVIDHGEAEVDNHILQDDIFYYRSHRNSLRSTIIFLRVTVFTIALSGKSVYIIYIFGNSEKLKKNCYREVAVVRR